MLSVMCVILFVLAMWHQYERVKVMREYEQSENMCYLWIIKDGVGFASPTEYCAQLQQNCDADYHTLNCEWKSNDVVDSNKTLQGCECSGE